MVTDRLPSLDTRRCDGAPVRCVGLRTSLRSLWIKIATRLVCQEHFHREMSKLQMRLSAASVPDYIRDEGAPTWVTLLLEATLTLPAMSVVK